MPVFAPEVIRTDVWEHRRQHAALVGLAIRAPQHIGPHPAGLVGCRWPTKSPWRNRIEPKWVHGKRAMAEPERKLRVEELEHRICAYYECELLEHIAQQVA